MQFLGLDVGTQGTKGLVLDTDRQQIVARAARSYGLLPSSAPGVAEQDPRTWEQAVLEVAAELATAPGVERARLAGLGVAGQQHGLVLEDGAGRVLRPAKLWCDTSTAAEARELERELGRPMPTGFTASKVRWVQRREPEVWRRARRLFLPHDWINWRLCGVAAMEAGDASGTGFFDVVGRRFEARAVALLGVGDLLPTLVAPDTLLGGLSREVAARTGLPAGLPLSAGAGDNMASAIGSGAVRPGVVTVSLGTSGTAFAHADRAPADLAGGIAPFCGSTGAWLPLLCVMNCTAVLEEVVRTSGRSHGELGAAAAREPIGTHGLRWLPFLAGERVPDLPEATGTLLGLRAGSLEPARLYRAALEGVSANLAFGLELLRRATAPFERVHLVGGAARNALWRQILADCFGLPVRPLAEQQSAALGAALQAAWAVGRRDQPDLDIATVVAPFVHPGGPDTEPTAAGRAAYGEVLATFRRDLLQLYAVDPASP